MKVQREDVFKSAPHGYHWEKAKVWKTEFTIGDIVNSECSDWAHDNPMVVIGFHGDARHPNDELVCRGKSGKIYSEIQEFWYVPTPQEHGKSKIIEVDVLVKNNL